MIQLIGKVIEVADQGEYAIVRIQLSSSDLNVSTGDAVSLAVDNSALPLEGEVAILLEVDNQP